MNQIKTIYPERPKSWTKGMERSNDRFTKSEVKLLVLKTERTRSQIGKIDSRLAIKERTVGKLLWLHSCRFFWGLRKDILKETLYRKQKSCLCIFRKLSSEQYDDHYVCPKCNCTIEFGLISRDYPRYFYILTIDFYGDLCMIITANKILTQKN